MLSPLQKSLDNRTGGDDVTLYGDHQVTSARVRCTRLGETDRSLDNSLKCASSSGIDSTISPSRESYSITPVRGNCDNTANGHTSSAPAYGEGSTKASKQKVEFHSNSDLPSVSCNPNKSLRRRGSPGEAKICFGRMKNFVQVDNKDLNKMANFKKVNDVQSFKKKKRNVKISNLRDIKHLNLNDIDVPVAQMLGGIKELLTPVVTHTLNPDQFEVIERLTNTFESMDSKISSIPSSVLQDVSSLATSLSGTIAGGPTMLVKTIISSFAELLGGYADANSKEIIFYISLVSILAYMNQRLSSVKDMLLVASIFMLAGKLCGVQSVSDVFTYVTTNIGSLFSESATEPAAQMSNIGLLSDFILSIFTIGLFPGLRDVSVKKISTYLADLARISSSIEHVVSLVMRILQYLLDLAAQKLGFQSFNMLTTSIPSLDKWVEDTRKFISDLRSKVKIECPTTYQELRTLEDRSYEILSSLGNSKNNHHVMFIVRSVSNELSKLRAQMEVNGVGERYARRPPLVIMLRGASQIGKSRALRPFILALLRVVMNDEEFEKVEEDFDAHVYSRVPETKFWDGYHGQKVCFFDEFNLTNNKLLTSENASSEIVRAGNVFPYMLHMANIESKGNVYFRSEIIICTSNATTVAAGAKEAVSHPEAVVNRFHFECQVEVSDLYVKDEDRNIPRNERPLDMSKLKSQEFDWNVHKLRVFKRTKLKTGSDQYTYVDTGSYGLREFVKLAAEKYISLGHLGEAIMSDDKSSVEMGKSIRDSMFKAQMSGAQPEMRKSRLCHKAFPHLANQHIVGSSEFEKALVLLEDDMQLRKDLELYSFIPFFLNQGQTLSTFQSYLDTFLTWDHDPRLIRFLFDTKLSDTLCEGHFNTFARICSSVYDPTKFVDINPSVVCEVIQIVKPLNSTWNRIKLEMFDNIESLCALAKSSAVSLYRTSLDFFWNSLTVLQSVISHPITISFAAGTVLNILVFIAKHAANLLVDKIFEPSERRPEAQMQDTAVSDIATKIWNKNYYALKLDSHAGWGFFSHDNIFVLCKHYVDFWRSNGWGEDLVYLQRGNEPEIGVKIKTFYESVSCGDDLCCVKLSSFRNHSDLRSLMLNESYLNGKKHVDVMLIRRFKDNIYRDSVKSNVVSNVQYLDASRTGKIMVAKSIKYPISTSSGDCGLPLFILDPKTRHQKFLGVHVAGAAGYGLSTLFGSKFFCAVQLRHEALPRMMVPQYDVTLRPGTSGKSNIIKSSLHSQWGAPTKSRAKLHPYLEDGERKIPLEETLKKFDNDIHVYDQRLVTKCVTATVATYVNDSHYDMSNMRAISDDDALFGIDGDMYMDAMNRKTSAGYPWNVKPRPGFKGKERFFGKDQHLSRNGPDFDIFMSSCKEKENMLLRGERPEFIYTFSLKDEVLPHHKVGKPRGFCACNAEYTFLFNKYFKRFTQLMMVGRIHNECAVGINPYSNEWGVLERKLVKFGKSNIIAGDFKSYDTNQAAQILKEIGESIFPIFRDREHDSIRRLLWMEVWNSNVIVDGTVVSWLQSLPSGHPATTIVNCLFNSTIMRMSFETLFTNEIDLKEFSDYVSLVVYGDDNVLGVNDIISSRFNQITLSETLATLGLTYTLETKTDGVVQPFRHISEIEFLKRSFRFESNVGRTVAPLRLSSILEMPYWTKRSDSYDITCTNVNNSLLELSLHKRETFDEWSQTIIEASIDNIGYYPHITDYNLLLESTLNKELPY